MEGIEEVKVVDALGAVQALQVAGTAVNHRMTLEKLSLYGAHVPNPADATGHFTQVAELILEFSRQGNGKKSIVRKVPVALLIDGGTGKIASCSSEAANLGLKRNIASVDTDGSNSGASLGSGVGKSCPALNVCAGASMCGNECKPISFMNSADPTVPDASGSCPIASELETLPESKHRSKVGSQKNVTDSYFCWDGVWSCYTQMGATLCKGE